MKEKSRVRLAAWRLALVLLLPGPTAVQGRSIELEIGFPSGYPLEGETVQVSIQATSTDGTEVHTGEVSAPGSLVFDLAGDGPWTVVAEAPGFWSPPRPLNGSSEGKLSLRLWPTSTLSGRLVLPRGESLDEPMTARFSATPNRSETAPPGAKVRCEVSEPDLGFSCELPFGTLDVRLRVRGFISHFFWEKTVEPGRTYDLGQLQLVRGSSFVGWIDTFDRSPIRPDQCELRLLPERIGEEKETARIGLLFQQARPTKRGFFHFPGVAPGIYSLEVRQQGLAPAEVHGIEVFEGFEATLRQPVVLSPLAVLEVRVDPPFGVDRQPWSIELVHAKTRTFTEATLTDPAGFWQQDGLLYGQYLLVVIDSRGDQLHAQEIEIEAARTYIDIELAVVPVTGTIFLGDDPLSGTLSFGGRFGAVKVALASDKDGKFQGILPREGPWRLDIEVADPQVERSIKRLDVYRVRGQDAAEVEIRLPDTRLRGEVVDDRGQPQPAVINVQPVSGEEELGFIRSPDGRFEVRGLQEGPVRLIADGGKHGWSEELVAQLSENLEPPPLRLVLRPHQMVGGVVLSPSHPVPGAQVRLRRADQVLSRGGSATTDVEGAFEIRIPRHSGEYLVWVEAPGFALRTFRLTLEAAETTFVEIPVDSDGGTLTLDVPNEIWQQEIHEYRVYVRHARSHLSTYQLRSWGRLYPEVFRSPPGPLIVPQMEYGDYSACILKEGSAEWVRFMLSAELTHGCVSGSLAPRGSLKLTLKMPHDETAVGVP